MAEQNLKAAGRMGRWETQICIHTAFLPPVSFLPLDKKNLPESQQLYLQNGYYLLLELYFKVTK